MKFTKINDRKYKVGRDARGSNQYRRKPKTQVNSYLGLLLLLILGGLYVQKTFHVDLQIAALAPTTGKAYALVLPTVTPTPSKPSKEAIIFAHKHGDIIYRIWGNETTRGTNKTTDPTALHQYCKAQGLTNEFGYDPQDKLCFQTFEESVDTIDRWFDKKLKVMSLREALLLYSGNSSLYAEKFLNQ